MKIKNIALFSGGSSSERRISLRSGFSVFRSLLKMNFSVSFYDLKFFDVNLFLNNIYDIVFIVSHGEGGEDGVIQGFLDFLKIPYTGSGVFSSSLTINKYNTKCFLEKFNINIVPHLLISKEIFLRYYFSKKKKKDFCFFLFKTLGCPLVLKPNRGGSSIGVCIVNTIENLFHYLNKFIFSFNELLIEKYIVGIEYTVSILNNKVLPILRIYSGDILYFNYYLKYSFKNKFYSLHDLSLLMNKNLSELSLKIWNLLGCSNFGRLDFIKDENDVLWFLEVNTIPGMSNNSLLSVSAKYAGISYNELIKKILFFN